MIEADDDIVVVAKPAGMICHSPDGPGQRSRPTAMDHAIRAVGGRRGATLYPVQHLDRDVSGVLAFARSRDAAVMMSESFRTRQAGRAYTALVCGRPGVSDDTTIDVGYVGTVHTMLVENRRGVMDAMPIGSELSDAQSGYEDAKHYRAVTHYRVNKLGEAFTLLRINAETDYPFQIRAHLASIGCPVAGDKAYSAPHDPISRVALHLGQISFLHPRTKREVRYIDAAPREIAKALDWVPGKDTGGAGWDEVADWYGALLSEGKSDLHENVVWPGVTRLLALQEGERVIDVACGPGDLGRIVMDAGATYAGVDASAKLIETAGERLGGDATLAVADATTMFDDGSLDAEAFGAGSFDAAACVLALMNIGDLAGAARSLARAVKSDGRVVVVLLHPATRSPRLSSWAWDVSGERPRQYRRLDAYLGEQDLSIVMNPGAVSKGDEPVTTSTHHRPISTYVNALSDAGLLVDRVEEWVSHRKSDSGPRAEEENRARDEFPMFLAIRAVKR